jgi:hypothetical protein
MSRPYWLVERRINGAPFWLSDDPCWSWVGTTAMARRFDDRESAERAAAGTDAVPTEHLDG